ncbi:MAG: dihydropyrimidinase, partial [Saprospiraceae bacterium]
MSILIKNGRIITAESDFIADLYIAGEKIEAIGKDLNYKADKEIDASGKLVFPGGIDPHVHLDMPFMGTSSSDDYETGTRAALFGGTTMVIDFILQTQGDTLHNALKTWQQKSQGKAIGDYSYHMAVTDFNDEVAKEVVELINEEGITSFKTFMAYKGALMIDDGQMV